MRFARPPGDWFLGSWQRITQGGPDPARKPRTNPPQRHLPHLGIAAVRLVRARVIVRRTSDSAAHCALSALALPDL